MEGYISCIQPVFRTAVRSGNQMGYVGSVVSSGCFVTAEFYLVVLLRRVFDWCVRNDYPFVFLGYFFWLTILIGNPHTEGISKHR